MWVKPSAVQGQAVYNYVFAYGSGYYSGCGEATTIGLAVQSNMLPAVANWCNDFIPGSGSTFKLGVWNMETVVINGQSATLYVNTTANAGSLPNEPANLQSGPDGIGAAGTNGAFGKFNGSISDVQVYNTALSRSQINKLYSEGLGGAPISNAGLVGWWTLDGNANDYSGNNNNGVATNVQWVSP